MINDNGSVLNGSLLGSAGEIRFVRLSSSAVCQAVATSVLTVSPPRLILRGRASATAVSRLTAKRALKSSVATASAAGALVLATRRMCAFSGAGTGKVAAQVNLIAVRRMATKHAHASAVGKLGFTKRRRMALALSGMARADGFCMLGRIIHIGSEATASITAYAILRRGLSMNGAGSVSAVAVSRIGVLNQDAVPERTMIVSGSDRAMFVSGGR